MRRRAEILLLILTLAGCGYSISQGPTTANYAGFGSDWTWELNSTGTFKATETTLPESLTGTWSRLSTGILQLSVATKSGGGTLAYSNLFAVDIPGVAILFRPVLSTETSNIEAVTSGSCPTADFTSNFIAVRYPAVSGGLAGERGTPAFGTITWNQSTATAILPSVYSLEDATDTTPYPLLGADSFGMVGACSAGKVSFVDATTASAASLWCNTTQQCTGAVAKMYLTSTGTGILTKSDGTALLFFPQASASSIASYQGQYYGMVTDRWDVTDVARLVTASIDGSGNIDLTGVVDPVEAGTVTNPVLGVTPDPNFTVTGAAVLSTADAPISGFIEGATFPLTTNNKMACIASTNLASSEKKIIFCVEQSNALGTHTSRSSMTLVSQ